MRNPASTPSPAPPRARTANEQLKEGWNKWLVRSILIAAILHTSVFVLSPIWHVPEGARESASGVLEQIEPLLSIETIEVDRPAVALFRAAEERPNATRPTEEAASISEREAVERLSTETAPVPAADEFLPVVAVPQPQVALASEDLRLETLSALTPRPPSDSLAVTWPTIRNPNAISRFLRRVYNPIAREPGSTGYVSVDMWIDEKGTVDQAQISNSSGSEKLDEIALTLFSEVASFAPARNRGVPIPVFITISVPFTVPW